MSGFQLVHLCPIEGTSYIRHHFVLLAEMLVYESGSCRACTSGGHIPMTDSIEEVEKQSCSTGIGVLVIV